MAKSCECRFGEAPSSQQVEDFNRLAAHFFEQHPMEVIGVHCTHGYNRTGFLIIAYLVEVQDWSLEAAVAAFANVTVILCTINVHHNPLTTFRHVLLVSTNHTIWRS